jgi:chromosome segregation ATPase
VHVQQERDSFNALRATLADNARYADALRKRISHLESEVERLGIKEESARLDAELATRERDWYRDADRELRTELGNRQEEVAWLGGRVTQLEAEVSWLRDVLAQREEELESHRKTLDERDEQLRIADVALASLRASRVVRLGRGYWAIRNGIVRSLRRHGE